jgi:hypothetical membrane protein
VKAIPWWVVVVGGAAPVLLIGGVFIATAIQPASYDPLRDTISELAGRGATDPWVMTSALVGVGFSYLFAALGLQPAGSVSRVLLAGGGVAVLSIAVFRQPQRGYSIPHELAVIAAALTCCTWPAFASHRRQPALLLTRAPSLAATGVSVVLVAWYALESRGALLGLAERCAAAAPALWLLAVTISARGTFTRRRSCDELRAATTRPSRSSAS